jgi:hypothetical protein
MRGLAFDHDSGHRDKYLFPEISCGGAALFDMDGDGDLDAYCIQAGNILDPPERRPPNRLFRNDGTGRFEDVTATSGAGDRGYGMGAATGDYDNDGDVDLCITNVGANVLLRNEGQGRFTDVTDAANVGNTGWGASAAFLDIDLDGDLDLFVVNYIRWSPETERECSAMTGERDYCEPAGYKSPTASVLYRNNGDGTFADISAASGIAAARGNGLGVVHGDFNGDGRPDIYVANDDTPNHLWIQKSDGTFKEAALLGGCAVDESGEAKAGMGVSAIDFDDDGDEDLLVGNLTNESSSFYRNEGDFFIDNTAQTGLGVASRSFTRFGMALADFNNDGWLDLYNANGRVRKQEKTYSDDPFAEPNQLFQGSEQGRLVEAAPAGGTASPLIATSRGAAFGDVNNDGGVDILVINRDGPAHLLINIARNRGHWIMFRILDEHGRDAHGSVVSLRLGGRTLRRRVSTAYSYCSANDPRVHVGLGTTTVAESVTVRWANGAVQTFGDLAADQVVTLRRTAALGGAKAAGNATGSGNRMN